MKQPGANKSVQATAAARFRLLALVVFIRSFCRPHPFPAAVPDLWRWGGAGRGHFAACVGGPAGVEVGRRKTNRQSG
jgi:hypothetical protein